MAEKTFRLEIISPDRIFYTNDVLMVEYNTVEGEVGVYAEHIPMTQIIAPGRLIITEENGQRTAALLSGFVEITPDKVTILAEAVEWPQNIDIARAERARDRAQQILSAEEDEQILLLAEAALKRALVRLDIAAAAEVDSHGGQGAGHSGQGGDHSDQTGFLHRSSTLLFTRKALFDVLIPAGKIQPELQPIQQGRSHMDRGFEHKRHPVPTPSRQGRPFSRPRNTSIIPALG